MVVVHFLFKIKLHILAIIDSPRTERQSTSAFSPLCLPSTWAHRRQHNLPKHCSYQVTSLLENLQLSFVSYWIESKLICQAFDCRNLASLYSISSSTWQPQLSGSDRPASAPPTSPDHAVPGSPQSCCFHSKTQGLDCPVTLTLPFPDYNITSFFAFLWPHNSALNLNLKWPWVVSLP